MCESVIASIARQEIHHRKMTFEEEFRTLLHKHRVPFNELGVGLIRESLTPFQQLQPGKAGVFHRGRSRVAPYEGVRLIGIVSRG
jgi:hypothetical protein